MNRAGGRWNGARRGREGAAPIDTPRVSPLSRSDCDGEYSGVNVEEVARPGFVECVMPYVVDFETVSSVGLE